MVANNHLVAVRNAPSTLNVEGVFSNLLRWLRVFIVLRCPNWNHSQSAARPEDQSGFPMNLLPHRGSIIRQDCYYLLSRWKETGMGHYCRICGRERPNEQFSGKGHRIHVCKQCKAKPKSERQAIEDKDDIYGFIHQSHISEKNVARLVQMAKSENPRVASLAAIVLEVARVKPYKIRRLKFLAQKHPQLLHKLEETGLVLAHTSDWGTAEVPAQANSEETEVFVREDLEATDLSAEEDWEIPF